MPKRKPDLETNLTPKLALTFLQILIIIIIYFIAVSFKSDIVNFCCPRNIFSSNYSKLDIT